MLDDVRVVEEGAADYGTRVVMTRQNLVSMFLLRVLFVVSGQGGTEVDPSAGTLSEAKTQRRTPQRERERETVRDGGCPLLLFLYLSFSRAGKDVRRERLREQAVKWVKCGGGVRRAAACLWGSLRATLRVTWAVDAPGASVEGLSEGRPALARGPQANIMNRLTSG